MIFHVFYRQRNLIVKCKKLYIFSRQVFTFNLCPHLIFFVILKCTCPKNVVLVSQNAQFLPYLVLSTRPPSPTTQFSPLFSLLLTGSFLSEVFTFWLQKQPLLKGNSNNNVYLKVFNLKDTPKLYNYTKSITEFLYLPYLIRNI